MGGLQSLWRNYTEEETLPGMENGILRCPTLNLVTVLSDRFQITLPYTTHAVRSESSGADCHQPKLQQLECVKFIWPQNQGSI